MHSDKMYHTNIATNAPTVPGATGEKPAPKLVAINLWNNGNFFTSLLLKSNYKITNNISIEETRHFKAGLPSLTLCHEILNLGQDTLCYIRSSLIATWCKTWPIIKIYYRNLSVGRNDTITSINYDIKFLTRLTAI